MMLFAQILTSLLVPLAAASPMPSASSAPSALHVGHIKFMSMNGNRTFYIKRTDYGIYSATTKREDAQMFSIKGREGHNYNIKSFSPAISDQRFFGIAAEPPENMYAEFCPYDIINGIFVDAAETGPRATAVKVGNSLNEFTRSLGHDFDWPTESAIWSYIPETGDLIPYWTTSIGPEAGLSPIVFLRPENLEENAWSLAASASCFLYTEYGSTEFGDYQVGTLKFERWQVQV